MDFQFQGSPTASKKKLPPTCPFSNLCSLISPSNPANRPSAPRPSSPPLLYDVPQEIPPLTKLLRVAFPALACAFFAACSAQRPAPQPLTEMPYAPSLDLTSMDKTIDPCVNFYAYACNGWKKLNPIPADQATWDVYAKLSNDNQQFLWGILEQDAKATDRTPIQQKVGDYFESCMNRPAINADGLKPIQPALARIDALKTRPELFAAIAGLHHDTPGNYFFRSGTGQDAVDSSTIIVEVGAGGLGLPDRDYYLKTDPKSVKLRTAILRLHRPDTHPQRRALRPGADRRRQHPAHRNSPRHRLPHPRAAARSAQSLSHDGYRRRPEANARPQLG